MHELRLHDVRQAQALRPAVPLWAILLAILVLQAAAVGLGLFVFA